MICDATACAPCGHLFCKRCLRADLPSCPVCRERIDSSTRILIIDNIANHARKASKEQNAEVKEQNAEVKEQNAEVNRLETMPSSGALDETWLYGERSMSTNSNRSNNRLCSIIRTFDAQR